MPTAREMGHRIVARLPLSLSMFGGLVVLQFLVPLSRGAGRWIWLILGTYVLLWLILVTYFGVRAQAHDCRFHREPQRRQPRHPPAGPTDLAG